MRQQYALRSLIIVACYVVVALAVIVQIIRIQNSEQALIFLSQGDRYAGEFQTVYPERGEIYDRGGHLLAGNRTVYEVGVSLSEMTSPETLASVLGTYLGLSYDEVFNKLTKSPESWSYVVIQDYVGAETVSSLQQLIKQKEDAGDDSMSGLGFKPHYQRSYPENSLASNLLGFVTRDGRGYFGIEEKYNDLLAGNPVQVWVPSDPNKATGWGSRPVTHLCSWSLGARVVRSTVRHAERRTCFSCRYWRASTFSLGLTCFSGVRDSTNRTRHCVAPSDESFPEVMSVRIASRFQT